MSRANWIKAEKAPRQWEGTFKLRYDSRKPYEGVVIDFVPRDYSRVPAHCAGIFFADIPEPPKSD